jgi:N-glycosylase/DNA lyase
VTAWLGFALDLAMGLVVLGVSGRGEAVGWAFYRRHMRAAERKVMRRELARIECATAMARYQNAQLAMVTSLHAHAHTMASLTGQAYLASGTHVSPVMTGDGRPYVPELVIPLAWPAHDPRYQPWKYPPS